MLPDSIVHLAHHRMEPPEADRSAPELEWIRRVRAGDQAAFEALFSAYYASLLRFAFGYVKNRAAAEEVVQDMFLKFWVQREQLDVHDTVRMYFYAATRNRALNWRRRNGLERAWAESVADPAIDAGTVIPRVEFADERAQATELAAAIRAAVDRLPPRSREAFLLSREHQLTYEQIARVMGISVKTVQEQMVRALRALRISLADWLT